MNSATRKLPVRDQGYATHIEKVSGNAGNNRQANGCIRKHPQRSHKSATYYRTKTGQPLRMVNHIGTHGASKRESVVHMGLQPGLYRSLSNEDYHADPSVSKSKLDVIGDPYKSPRHYYDKYLSPDREAHDPTEAMVLGAALHVAVLEPDEFPSRYLAAPEKIDRRTREGKAEWAAFVAEAENRIALKAEDYGIIVQQRDAVFKCKEAWTLLEHASKEESFFAIDPETGLSVRARPDALDRRTMEVADLKRTVSATAVGFGKAAANYRYDVQGGWYPYVMSLANGEVVRQFNFVCVESTRPFAVGVYYLTPEQYVDGLAKAKADLALIADCTRRNFWPDPAAQAGGPQPLQLPGWYARKREMN